MTIQNKLSLKDMLLAKAQAKEKLAESEKQPLKTETTDTIETTPIINTPSTDLINTNKVDIIPTNNSISSKLSIKEKLALSQSTHNALKNESDTNIKDNNENAPNTLKSALVGVLHRENSILPLKSENSPPNTLPIPNTLQPSTKRTLQDIIREKREKTSQEELIQQAEVTASTLMKDMKIYSVEDAKKYNNNNSSEATTKEENIIASNVKLQSLLSLKERLALKAKANNTSIKEEPIKIKTDIIKEVLSNETFSLNIVLNDKQQAAVNFAESGKSFVLLGAAGTGKTSSEREILHALLGHNNLSTCSFKKDGNRYDSPSVAVVAYTRRAAANSAKAILKDPLLNERLPANIMTIHNLLEYIPEVYYDVVTETEKFRFAPTRNKSNPLTITHLLIEEATLVGLDLWEALYEALPYDVQIIFVGDINQLPPVFGPSILNYALTKLPVIELTQVYRQAEGSPIINNAHRILRGENLEEGQNEQGRLTIISGKRDIKVGQARSAYAIANMFKGFYESGAYNPEEDMILSPWNKHELGTDAMNNHIAEFLSVKNNMLVYEVIAGFSKRYLAEGDKVICNKRDAIIVSIERNPAYVGKEPRMAGTDLSRYGTRRASQGESIANIFDEDETVGDYNNFSLESLEETAMDRKMQSSHKVTIAYEDGYTDTLTGAAELQFGVFSLGYSMTVHKSQGSEWRRVFCIFHPDHAISLSREMLYTAITRAREEVYLIAKRYVVDNAVSSQRIKGNTLQDKITIFNSGVKEILAHIRVTKPSIENR